MASFSGLGTGDDWPAALDQALAGASGGPPDLALLFASWHYRAHYPELLAALHERLGPKVLLGCSGQAIIGTEAEVESAPALSLMALELPGADLRVTRLEHGDLEALRTTDSWRRRLGPPGSANAFLVFADPFTFDTEALVGVLGEAYPGISVVGGMASASPPARATELFHDTEVLYSGATLLSVGGAWTLEAIVSQGAEPIGQAWTVTGAEGNIVRGLGGRPPLEVLVETMRQLPPEMQHRAARNLLVGLAMNEYRHEFHRGDFLIRNLLGVDQESGAIVIGAFPRVGQTLQFQVRDAGAAHADLETMLGEARGELADAGPAGALLCSCNGRGAGLFGQAHHDAQAVARQFGPLPVAGFFCNGEVGPVGERSYVHGFTASIGFFVPAGPGTP
ncbi:MAG: FIST N-terminal domain-containing protein [Hyphomicrobiales bacterium]